MALAETHQPFRDLNCFYRRYKTVRTVKVRNGIEYVVYASHYENGMAPETELTMQDMVRYLNDAPRLEFLPIYL